MTLLENAGEPLPDELSRLDELTPFAVELRYDEVVTDVPFDRAEAREAIRRLRAYVESKVGSAGS